MPDVLPSIYSIKIVIKPKEANSGTLEVYAHDANSNYTTQTSLTPYPGEPNCTNSPVTGTYGSGIFSGDATFNAALSVNPRGYSATVVLLQGSVHISTTTLDASVENPPAV